MPPMRGHQGNRVVLQLAVLTTVKIVQGSGDMGEVLDEMTEVPYSSNKLPDYSNGGGGPILVIFWMPSWPGSIPLAEISFPQ